MERSEMRLTIIILSFVVMPFINSFSQNNFEKLKSKCDLKKYEYMIVVFVEPGNCVKCEILPQWLIQCVSQRVYYRKFNSIALLAVNREKELKQISRRISWDGLIARDDNELKKQLKISGSSDFAIIDYKGKLIFEVSTLNEKAKSDEMCEQAVKAVVK